jgi:hypothetical protein
LCYLPLGWKEVPFDECITKLGDKFHFYFLQLLQNLIGYEIVTPRYFLDFYYSHFFNRERLFQERLFQGI